MELWPQGVGEDREGVLIFLKQRDRCGLSVAGREPHI